MQVFLGNSGKENGNYYSISGFILGIVEKNMETTVLWQVTRDVDVEVQGRLS